MIHQHVSASGLPHGYDPQELDRAMVRVPAGRFDYGMTEAERRAAADEAGVHPDHLSFQRTRRTAETGEFWMDRYPVTRGQFARFMRETGYEIVRNGYVVGWQELSQSWPPDDPAQAPLPVIGVNSEDAEAYAKWAGKRLPTEVEWERAARGTDARRYPWGNEFDERACPLSRGDVPFAASFSVGSWPAGASPYGAMDMQGLVCQYVRAEGPASHILTGSGVFHVLKCSHMVTNRFGWHPLMRNYVTGFRCVSDGPPAGLVEQPMYRPVQGHAPAPLPMRRDLYLREPITFSGSPTTTLLIHVPWFPGSVWAMDVPENDWGPFPGANGWPAQPEAFIDWRVTEGGRRISYARVIGESRVTFEAWSEGHTVFYRFGLKNVAGNRVALDSLCLKTISPFFSSQERVTQGVLVGGELRMVRSMPMTGGSAPFWWRATELDARTNTCGIIRSYDGSAYVANVGKPPCAVFGNGSIPCMHLGNRPEVDGEGGKLVFLIGSLEELKRELRYPDFQQE